MEALKERVKSTIWKLKQPGVKRTLLLANIGGVAYTWLTSIVVTVLTLFVTLPTLYEDNPAALRFQRVLFTFIIVSMMVNYILSIFKNSYFDAKMTNANTAESASKGWAYCTPCQQYIPPRCHHCIVCEQCVLKRDSHCFFTGQCVGHRNQRYFVVFLFYAAVAAFYAVLGLSFISLHVGSFFSSNIVYYIYPIATFMWMAGSLPGFVYLSLTIFYMCITIVGGCTFLFCMHFYHALNGQTSHEATTGVTKYRHTSLKNLHDVFGSFWILNFLLPMPFAQPSDGITWSQCKELKGY
ncbi:LOW QUALITY PROTEIN: palmitoyltransferase ZDHHC22-like [Amphiura filiformis]|uniref:LOW QUALITY PROTEIN: palmitoyltransferase ZDHHC22-like n=1 Tax=Amphiura filiformis TaxID=82378 RepID=UPI003B221A0B